MSIDSVMFCSVKRKGDLYEGTVTLPGLRPTKLIKKDSSSTYANRNGVVSGAKALADRLKLTLEVSDTGSPATKSSVKSTKVKKAVATVSSLSDSSINSSF